MGKYDEIINLSRPKSNRIPMPIADRAKIFMPFAALKGYEEAIEEKQRLTSGRIELSEEKKQELDDKLKLLESLLKEKSDKELPQITVRYFVPDIKKTEEMRTEAGTYEELTDSIIEVVTVYERLQMSKRNIAFGDIFDMEILEI